MHIILSENKYEDAGRNKRLFDGKLWLLEKEKDWTPIIFQYFTPFKWPWTLLAYLRVLFRVLIFPSKWTFIIPSKYDLYQLLKFVKIFDHTMAIKCHHAWGRYAYIQKTKLDFKVARKASLKELRKKIVYWNMLPAVLTWKQAVICNHVWYHRELVWSLQSRGCQIYYILTQTVHNIYELAILTIIEFTPFSRIRTVRGYIYIYKSDK